VTGLVAALVLAVTPAPDALSLLARHECNRCHVVEGLPSFGVERGCADCHRDISSAATRPARDQQGREDFGDAWPTFVARTGKHYVHVPSLTGLSRFRSTWLRDFLRAPYDLRPHLQESMIRHAMTELEIDRLVAALRTRSDEAATVSDPDQVSRGAAIYDALACNRCHQFAHRPAIDVASPERALAPDLRHARDRMNRSTLVSWLRDPRAMKSDTVMPAVAVPDDALESLAAFVMSAPIDSRAVAAPPKSATPTAAATYENVETLVLRDTCWHCHSDPDPETGEGEPGNTGGFGFRAAGLSLETYASIKRGAIGPSGKRHSILVAPKGQEPSLLSRLKRRHIENVRDHIAPGSSSTDALLSNVIDPAPRGMPLGLPALDYAQIDLVARWLAAGAPGPSRSAPRRRSPMR